MSVYHLTDKTVVEQLWDDLDTAGWNVIKGAGHPAGLPGSKTYWVEGSLGDETVRAEVGQVVIPRQNLTKVLVMSEDEFTEMQEVFGA